MHSSLGADRQTLTTGQISSVATQNRWNSYRLSTETFSSTWTSQRDGRTGGWVTAKLPAELASFYKFVEINNQGYSFLSVCVQKKRENRVMHMVITPVGTNILDTAVIYETSVSFLHRRPLDLRALDTFLIRDG